MAGVSLIVSSPPNMFFNFKKYGKSTRVSNHENCDVAEEIEKILFFSSCVYYSTVDRGDNGD